MHDDRVISSGGLLLDDSPLQITSGLGQVRGLAEVAPVILVGPEGQDFFALGREPEISVNDGEHASLAEHREEAGRNDVDAGKS